MTRNAKQNTETAPAALVRTESYSFDFRHSVGRAVVFQEIEVGPHTVNPEHDSIRMEVFLDRGLCGREIDSLAERLAESFRAVYEAELRKRGTGLYRR